MAGVRDPAFWKRFSMAVHLDEETGTQRQAELKDSESWLARQHSKRNRHTKICCFFWLGFVLVIAAVIGVVAWLLNSGALGGVDASGSQIHNRMIR